MKILAGIVTFNPELDRLSDNIAAVLPQVDHLIVVDNGSSNLSEIQATFPQVEIIPLIVNKGIAAALNVIGQYAIDKDYEWFLTLDQDTVINDNLVSLYQSYVDLPDVGILSSIYQDINGPSVSLKNEPYDVVDDVITSAALMKTEVFKVSRRFDEWMFIDLVDFDINREFQRLGYRIYKINQVGFYHEIGSIKGVNILGKMIYPKNHSPFRKYYIYRNTIYMIKKYGLNKITINYVRDMVLDLVKVLLFEKKRLHKISSILKGIRDGIKCKVMREL